MVPAVTPASKIMASLFDPGRPLLRKSGLGPGATISPQSILVQNAAAGGDGKLAGDGDQTVKYFAWG